MSANPPSVIGKYQIIREIARSNDIVYEAYDPELDRRVAVKELNIPPGSSPDQIKDRVDRFEREARAAGRLAHPNIMTVFDVSKDGDRHYMAMEFLDGHTLRTEMDQGPMDIPRVVEVSVAVLKGLSHAHANGVVHRDIKPENIQILSNGSIKITDFGIARLIFQPNITMAGQVFGTPSYMSPEQVKGGDIDQRSDIFSVGILVHEMLAGEKPFSGDNVISITHAILNNEPQIPRQANFLMQEVLRRALDKSPSMRYASADEMMGALESAGRVTTADVMAPPPFQLGNSAPAPPPITYPYNPYIPPDPNAPANPYGAPPAQQPYGAAPQPYGTPYGAPPNPYGTQMPPPVPIYYPKPPAKPLFTPEQSAFLSRVILITLVVGTFLAAFVFTIMYFTTPR